MGWEGPVTAHYPEEWKVARADEWGGLESRCGLRVTMGSNPIPSAKIRVAITRGTRWLSMTRRLRLGGRIASR